jgi:hypothetical protein
MSTKTQSTSHTIVPYELRLSQDWEFSAQDSDLYFTKRNLVFQSLDRITTILWELKIPYTIIGTLAAFELGYRRFTDNVDLLISATDSFHLQTTLASHNYAELFAGSRSLRDQLTGVKIDFYQSGNLPGKQASLPVKFPEPLPLANDSTNKNYADLATYITIQLAAGYGKVPYNRHFVDVYELIKATKLPLQVIDFLHEFVRPKYHELWKTFRSACKYVQYFNPNALDHERVAEQLRLEGLIQLPNKPGLWISTDPDISIKYEMHEVEEWDSDYHLPDNN